MELYINNSDVDNEFGESGTEWVRVLPEIDSIIFSSGSNVVADGEPIPGMEDLNRAAVQLHDENPTEVEKFFLAKVSDNQLKEIFLAGRKNTRYSFCVKFDDETLSEPQLEAWDNLDMKSYEMVSLGGGTPNNSWYRGICTTAASPGEDWLGIPIAGAEDSHVIKLNNNEGALTEAKNLYFNLRISIPPSEPSIYSPVLVITWASN